ncbi:MAG: hypothetical protein ACFE8N_08920 [Promethearchaeota archaeon]
MLIINRKFRLKIAAIGWEPAKRVFIRNCERLTPNDSEKYYKTIGACFRIADYFCDSGDQVRFLIWDVNCDLTYHFFKGSIVRFSGACLLFYDISNPQSYEDLYYWFKIIRLYCGYIPIFIIAFKSMINDWVNVKGIQILDEKYNFSGIYLISYQNASLSSQIFDLIITRTFEKLTSLNPDFNNLFIQRESDLYRRFVKFYSNCPICRSQIHKSTLDEIYFSGNKQMENLKENLMRLMENSEKSDKISIKKLKTGIPCCSCYKKVFSG